MFISIRLVDVRSRSTRVDISCHDLKSPIYFTLTVVVFRKSIYLKRFVARSVIFSQSYLILKRHSSENFQVIAIIWCLIYCRACSSSESYPKYILQNYPKSIRMECLSNANKTIVVRENGVSTAIVDVSSNPSYSDYSSPTIVLARSLVSFACDFLYIGICHIHDLFFTFQDLGKYEEYHFQIDHKYCKSIKVSYVTQRVDYSSNVLLRNYYDDRLQF